MDRPRFEHSAVCSDRESGGQAIKKEEHGVGNGRKMRGSYFRRVIKGSITRLMGYTQGVGLRFKPLVVILGRRVHLIQPNLGLRLVRLSVLVPPHPHSPGRAGKNGKPRSDTVDNESATMDHTSDASSMEAVAHKESRLELSRKHFPYWTMPLTCPGAWFCKFDFRYYCDFEKTDFEIL